MFDSIATLAVAQNMRDLYRLVLVDTPLAPYFSGGVAQSAACRTPSRCIHFDSRLYKADFGSCRHILLFPTCPISPNTRLSPPLMQHYTPPPAQST